MPTAKQKPPPAPEHTLRDRVKEMRRVKPSEIALNDHNWRLHPYAQRLAIAESLSSVGIADVLIAYESERNGGQLTYIDGHARAEEEPDVEWPTVILDVTDEEADQLLLTLDPMTAMAELDGKALAALVDGFQPGTPALEDMARNLRLAAAESDEEIAAALALEAEGLGPPEMELQAFEHYDYVMLIFRDGLDWSRAKEHFGLREEGFTLRDGVTRKVGLGRVVDGKHALALLEAAAAKKPKRASRAKKPAE